MSSDSTISHPSPSAAQHPVKPVTERALIRRINRILACEGRTLHVSRYPSRVYHNLGRYYQLDQYNDPCGPAWVTMPADLEAYAREIGALGPDETLKAEAYL